MVPNEFYVNSVNKKDDFSTESNDINGIIESLVKYYVKEAYYTFDTDEVNAFLQELYVELKQYGSLEKCNTYKRIKDVLDGYKKYVNGIAFPENKWLESYYGNVTKKIEQILKNELGDRITTQQFMKHCEKGIKLWNSGLRRILARYNEERGITSNGSFKQYASNEIPREEIVWLMKNKPSLWKRIVNKLKKR